MNRPLHKVAKARPFLKWAGGKTQLLAQLAAHYPCELVQGQLTRHVEPFLGSGAVFLDIAQHYPLRFAYLNDANREVILAFAVVQRDPQALIDRLLGHQQRYMALEEDAREESYYAVRSAYNAALAYFDYEYYSAAWIDRAAQMILLNKTCYNGLYRVNSRGEFNVPFGRYKKPAICDAQNIMNVSRLLQIAALGRSHFSECERYVDNSTFVYFDPPYRPLSATSNFTSYSPHKFGDGDQTDLARFFARLHGVHGARLMLSNSDPANVDATDTFFDHLYRRFTIHKVCAKRMINSKASRRGKISELLITNY
jgi:DNA adenine methylase